MKIPGTDSLSRFIPAVIRFATGFAASVKSGDFFRNLKVWWVANWLFALVSLIIAAVVFYQVKTSVSESATQEFLVRTECPDLPDAYIAPDQGKVTVRVSGALKDIREFESPRRKEPITLKVDKAKAEEGAVIAIKPKNIPALKGLGLQVVSIKPDEVKIQFDGRAPVEFKISDPEFTGNPYHGYVKGFEIEPKTVKLRGQTKRLQALAQNVRLSVPKISVANLSAGEVEKVCDVIVPPDISREDYDFLSDEKVTVKITIGKLENEKKYSSLPLRLSLPPPKPGETSLPDGYMLEPKAVAAVINGYEESVIALSNATVTAYAYVADRAELDLSPGATNRVPVRIEVPHDKEIYDVVSMPPEVLLIMPMSKKVPPPPVPETAAATAPKEETPAVAESMATKAVDAPDMPVAVSSEAKDVVPKKDEPKNEPVEPEEKTIKENQESEKQ